jgi:hypothetical protein
LIAAELKTLDPGRNISRIQLGQFELEGPYFPGHFKGDRVTLCVRPEHLKATPRDGRLGTNQIAGEFERWVERSQFMRLECVGGIGVNVAYADFEELRNVREWAIEFPKEALRVV